MLKRAWRGKTRAYLWRTLYKTYFRRPRKRRRARLFIKSKDLKRYGGKPANKQKKPRTQIQGATMRTALPPT